MHQAAACLKTESRLEGSENTDHNYWESVQRAQNSTHLSEFYWKDPPIWSDALEGGVENYGVSWQHQTEGTSVDWSGLRDRLKGGLLGSKH